MNAIAVLCKSVWYFTLTAALLALVAAALMLALEELVLRRWLNRNILVAWARLRVPTQLTPAGHGPNQPPVNPEQRWFEEGQKRLGYLSSAIYALPPRQLIGALSSSVQGDVSPKQVGPLAKMFAWVGADLLGSVDDTSALSRVLAAGEDASQLLFLAERALDDLQAHLASRWVRIRYVTSLTAIATLVGLLMIGRGSGEEIGIAGPLFIYPVVMVVGAVFGPPLRDLVERMSTGQR